MPDPEKTYHVLVGRDFTPTLVDYPDGPPLYPVAGGTLSFLAQALGWRIVGENTGDRRVPSRDGGADLWVHTETVEYETPVGMRIVAQYQEVDFAD